jgi:opacity protein-like surface antigen
MRSKIFTVVALVSLVASATSVLAVGEAGVPSLIIPPGARANGMGESFVAIADDATAPWWNAGGLAFMPGHNLALMHSQLVPDLANDVYYEYLGYTNQISNFGTFGVSVVYLTYGTSVATNTQGIETGTFKSWEASVMATLAIPLGESVGLGLTGKFIHADLAPADLTLDKLDGTGSTVALDAGVLWKLAGPRLNFGAAVTNVGPDITFIDQEQSDPLPITLRVGTAWHPVSSEVNSLLLTFDLEQSLVWLIDSSTDTRRSEIYHAGMEYRYINLLAGRLGYVYDKDGDFKDATYGLGFIYKDKVFLDYANVPQAQTLDRVHRWSVAVSF